MVTYVTRGQEIQKERRDAKGEIVKEKGEEEKGERGERRERE